MFLLDLYRFCESWKSFSRQHLALFVFKHRECSRLARAAGVSPRFFASMISKECLSRWATAGYLDINKGDARSKGPDKRPVNFEFESFRGRDSVYMLEMMNVGKLYDDQIFRGSDGRTDNGGSPPCSSEADLTAAILKCRAQLIAYCNARDAGTGTQPS